MQANSTYIRVLASALSSTYGVKVEEGNTWAFNSEQKTLIYNPVTLLERPVEVVRGILLHQIGHLLYTVPVSSSKIYQDYPVINYVYNAFEDVRIERELKSEFGYFAKDPLDVKNIDQSAIFFEKNALVGQGKATQIASITTMVDLIMQIMTGHISYRGYEEEQQLKKIRAVEDGLDKFVDKDVYEASQVIQQKEDWRQLIQSAQIAGSFEVIQHIVDTKVFPYIKHLIENDPENEAMKQAMAAQAQAAADAKAGKPKPEGEEGEGEAMASKTGDSTEEKAGVIGAELPEPGTGTTSNSRHGTKVPPYIEASAMVSPYTQYLASRIKDILKENSAINFHGNLRAGKLLSRNVTKLVLGEEKVFSKRNQLDSPKHHLIVALDGSGSMSGENEYNAYLGTVIAMDTFRKLRMPFNVFEFSNFTNHLVSDTDITPKFLNYRSYGGGTNDDNMIMHVADFMRKKPEDTFLFIIIGDGQGNRLPKRELEYIQTRGSMLAIGIGAGANEVVRAYPNGVSIPDVTKVPEAILSELHGYIHR